ncbi:transposase [Paenibacillus larvae]|nr:transposase [Paenibacillus larvae]MDT2294676.1 transposase [Paenibacillus larvae]
MTMKRDTSFGKKMNSTPLKRFFPFFKRSWRLYPTGKLALVLDNARIHAKLLRPFLKRKNRLELVYCLPYSPQLNIRRTLEMAQVQCDQ